MKLLTVVALSVALVLMACVAHAKDDPNDRQDADHPENDAERDVDIKLKGSSVEIDSDQKVGKDKDKFQLSVNFNGTPLQLDMRRFSKINDTNAGFQFRIRPYLVMEYVDVDGIAGYNAGADTACTVYLIRGQDCSRGSLSVGSIGGVTASSFDVFTSNNVFRITTTVAGGGGQPSKKLVKDGRSITPTSAKFDIAINAANFNYSCPNSMLTLLMKVKSKQTSKTVSDNTSGKSKAVQLGTAATPLGFFTWADTVQVNGGSVNASIAVSAWTDDTNSDGRGETDLDSGEAAKRAWFSFLAVRPQTLFWDPEIGYADSTVTSPAARIVSSLWTWAAVAVAFIFATVYHA
jgi:hypothetical protein